MQSAESVFEFASRVAESPLVETIWHTRSDSAGAFMSTAVSNWEFVVARHNGTVTVGVRGPETVAMPVDFWGESEYFGIQFRLGAYIPSLPTLERVNSQIFFPDAGRRSFWMDGYLWEIPTIENADAFIDRLVRRGLLSRDPLVDDVVSGRATGLSERSVQRRFLHATGLTHGTVAQIERARLAVALLEEGVSILDTVALAGYADQPHLTRSLRRFYGRTPARLARASEHRAVPVIAGSA
jgi:AraC-like DNA-binding protein